MKKNLYKETTEEEREKIKEELRELLKKSNNTIYQIVTSVSPSGMSRYIKNFIPCVDNNGKLSIVSIDWHISKVLDIASLSNKGLFIKGYGMDYGFWIAYNLGRVLYPNGDGKTITGRNGSKEPETDGGYLINNVWV